MKKNIFDAIDFANKVHWGQFRKSSSVPKMVHLIGVMNILLENNYDNEIAIAGLLHDSLEDTSLTKEDLKLRFGVRVASLVEGASENDKSKSWEERKNQTIEYLKTAPIDVCVIVCADKIDNFRFTRRVYEKIGDEVWLRFNRGKEQQKWYFQSIVKILKKRLTSSSSKLLVKELEKEVNFVFKNNRK